MPKMIIGGGDDGDMKALGELFQDIVNSNRPKRRGKIKLPIREAVEATMREIADVYGKCPFKNGDLVTPKPGMNLRDEGVMHIVLHVEDNPKHHFSDGNQGGNSSSAGYGRLLDVRVLCLASNDEEMAYVPFWMESWQLQPYDPDKDPNYS